MVLVKSLGDSSFIGINDESVPINERPRMPVYFSYDFQISSHEVTCGEFSALLKNIGSCENDSLPQTMVTYFDAVLYANARSKAENKDTAYTYANAAFDSSGNCILLEGLLFDAEKDAYRLPTEAEWIYAANKGWDPEDGWTAENSDYKLHKVCTKNKNEVGLCDMAGNVMEWVNDWFRYLQAVPVENYVGSPDGGVLNLRILKGGSYLNQLANVNLYSRGDVYSVTSVSKAEYVGFRLAYGAIPGATWIDFSGSQKTSPLKAHFSGARLKSFTKTSKALLAFRNDESGNIAYMDFAIWNESIFEINDTINSYHPEISPDGAWVAFCTKPEGTSGKSELYVRRLQMVESYAIKLDVESAAIPRWIVDGEDTLITYVTDAGSNRDEATWKGKSTWRVSFQNEQFGVPEKIMEGSFHGGVANDLSFAVTGTQLLRTAQKEGSAYKLSTWYGGEQACNVSLAKDGSKRVMFLDFAGEPGIEFVGERYDVHEKILIADSTGKLIKYISAPEGYAFDHVEWVNSDYAIVSLSNSQGAHTAIAMVDLNTSKVQELVSGGEVWHPSMKMDKPFLLDSTKSRLDPDSAGAYFLPAASVECAILRQKMEIFWRDRDTINTVILGSSRPSAAVDPYEFGDDIYAVNMTMIPHIMYESWYLFKNYLVNHAKKLKNIVISVDIDLWYLSETATEHNFFVREAPLVPGFVYDVNHDFWKDGYPEGMQEYVENSFERKSDREVHSYHRGQQKVEPNGWGKEPVLNNDSNWLDTHFEDYKRNLAVLISIIELAAEKDINVVGVVFPQNPAYRETGSFGRYGIRRSQADSLLQEISDLSKTYPNFKLLDENKMGNHDYPDSLAVNWDHLSSRAGRIITPRIDSVLHTF